MDRSAVIARKRTLDHARDALKRGFVGIDTAIDTVMDAIGPWYLIPEAQERPTVVNLWGMTGTGKTALVERLSEELGFRNRYLRFSLASEDVWADLETKLRLMAAYSDGIPLIIALDEFQKARMVDEESRETRPKAGGMVWDLLDSGKLQLHGGFTRFSESVSNLRHSIRECIARGVRVRNGRVMEGVDAYRQLFSSVGKAQTEDDLAWFPPRSQHQEIVRASNGLFADGLELERRLQATDEVGVLGLLNEVLVHTSAPTVMDCSKSLIFVIGNLDEAYRMCGDPDPEADADGFHERSLRITVPEVKSALRKRFTSEQISRLGNTHVLYPALSSDAFREIIARSLSDAASRIGRQYRLAITFEQTVHDLVYREGVYPGQGARPVLSTVNQLVAAHLSRALADALLLDLHCDEVRVRASDSRISFDYHRGDDVVHRIEVPVRLEVDRLRRPRGDDLQAITAVHEAGHAVVSVVLLGMVPTRISSVSATAGAGGATYVQIGWDMMSRSGMMDRMAYSLGGVAAEGIVFGDERLSSGSATDISQATALALRMLKELGMGRFPGHYQAESYFTNLCLHDPSGHLEQEAEARLFAARQVADCVLRQNEPLLVRLADILSDRASIGHEELRAEVLRFIPNLPKFPPLREGGAAGYRALLKARAGHSPDRE